MATHKELLSQGYNHSHGEKGQPRIYWRPAPETDASVEYMIKDGRKTYGPYSPESVIDYLYVKIQQLTMRMVKGP